MPLNINSIGSAILGKIDTVVQSYKDFKGGNYIALVGDVGDLLSFVSQLFSGADLPTTSAEMPASEADTTCCDWCQVAEAKLEMFCQTVQADIKLASAAADASEETALTGLGAGEIFQLIRAIAAILSMWKKFQAAK